MNNKTLIIINNKTSKTHVCIPSHWLFQYFKTSPKYYILKLYLAAIIKTISIPNYFCFRLYSINVLTYYTFRRLIDN